MYVCIQRSTNWDLCNKQSWNMPLRGRQLQGQHHCGRRQKADVQNTWGKHCYVTEMLIVPDCYMFAYVTFTCVATLMSVWVDVCQLVCVNQLLLFRWKTVFLTWRPLCSSKGSSARSITTKNVFLRWHMSTVTHIQLLERWLLTLLLFYRLRGRNRKS